MRYENDQPIFWALMLVGMLDNDQEDNLGGLGVNIECAVFPDPPRRKLNIIGHFHSTLPTRRFKFTN